MQRVLVQGATEPERAAWAKGYRTGMCQAVYLIEQLMCQIDDGPTSGTMKMVVDHINREIPKGEIVASYELQ